MHKRKYWTLIVVALGVLVVWSMLLLRPGFEAPLPLQQVAEPRAESVRGDERTQTRVQAAAPHRAPPAPAPAASAMPAAVDATPDVAMLSDEQLTAAVAVVDQEIDDRDYVARANAGQLADSELQHFGALLARRDVLHVAKVQRLLAMYDTHKRDSSGRAP